MFEAILWREKVWKLEKIVLHIREKVSSIEHNNFLCYNMDIYYKYDLSSDERKKIHTTLIKELNYILSVK